MKECQKMVKALTGACLCLVVIGGSVQAATPIISPAKGQDEAQQKQLQEYDRAYSACLTGRGYTVK